MVVLSVQTFCWGFKSESFASVCQRQRIGVLAPMVPGCRDSSVYWIAEVCKCFLICLPELGSWQRRFSDVPGAILMHPGTDLLTSPLVSGVHIIYTRCFESNREAGY